MDAYKLSELEDCQDFLIFGTMTRRHLTLLKSARRSLHVLDRHRDAWHLAPSLSRLHPSLLARVRRLADLICFHQQHPDRPDALPDEVASLTSFLAESIDPAVAKLPESSALRAAYRDVRRVGNGLPSPGPHDEAVDPEALRFEAALILEETAPPSQLRLPFETGADDLPALPSGTDRGQRLAASAPEPAALNA